MDEEKALLQDEVDKSSKNWQNISKQNEIRQKNIDKLMKPARKFTQKAEAFVVALRDLERKSKELNIGAENYREPEAILKHNKVGQ